MFYSITAKQKNFTAPSVAIPHYMNEKGEWRKMEINTIEINDVSLAWFILRGIVDDFIEYSYENEGDWSIQICKTPNGGEFEFFEIDNKTADGWDEKLSGWL